MDVSDGLDKSWDHPWTTEEMRKKRREWSLAGDVGLLKHLQQFSENLMSKTNKTQAALDTLTTQLKETGILVDNVTNTSLALANTQFIESRVQEDDIEIKENSEEKEKTQDTVPENLLASISESVKQGLNIMDEKYKVMDVACSDSEEEDEGSAVVFSVIVGPNDPYQDRPLPYIIGSDKWMASNKIGLESSSSESEQADEEREESKSENEDENVRKIFNSGHNSEINIARLSSSSSDSDNYNDPSSNTSYMNNKADAISQNNINSGSGSESATPNNVSKVSNETAPNFAEELAKRLGTVRQAQKPAAVNEASESSINRFKDDLFTSEKDEDMFNDDPDSLFNDKKSLFNDQVSTNLWKEKPIKPYKNNIIPPSIDVPPPINIISTKPKSAIDDLFADADSEEESDDLFSSKNTIKKRTKEPSSTSNTYHTNAEEVPKKFLDIVAPKTVSNIATSTPESNIKASSLFSDDENDDADLFGNPKKQFHQSTSTLSSANTTQKSNIKKRVGDVSILGHVLASDNESKLSNRIMQRQRQESSDSSDSDAPGNSDNATKSNGEPASAERSIFNDNIAVADRSSQIVPAENPAGNISVITENTNNTSGISMQQPSIDNTVGSGLWVNFQPEMSSTRLKSEEIYRERITSDSLFAARSRHPVVNVNNNNNQQQQSRQEQQDTSSALLQDDVFENDDLFGPPPLPSKSDSKRAIKSKVSSSLFDDSDSGDELFSVASSSSRSQKSTDCFAAVSSNDKTKSASKSGGLFDDDVNIFGGKDAPDVDIFGVVSKSKSRDVVTDSLSDSRGQDFIVPTSNNVNKLQNTRMESKQINLFDDDGDDVDLFGAKLMKSKSEHKTDLFEKEDDLFLSTKASSKGHFLVEKNESVEPKTEISEKVFSFKVEKKIKDDSLQNDLFSKTTKSRNLLFEDDDYDDLFNKKDTAPCEDILQSNPESKKVKKEDVAEQIQELPEKNISSAESLNLNYDAKTIVESNVAAENDEKSKAEIEGTSFNEKDGTVKKSSPPKTLNIRTTSSPSSEEQSSQQVPRRLVSGKIKNLMGKMGDLKILSPMDAPPLWRKSEDKTDEDEDVVDRDSDSGGLGITGRISPPSVSEDSARKESSYSTISTISNTEAAINFDDLAQVETLSTTASKSRVRIQAKRRPQSRHARKSALRHSGIDFDTVDNTDNDNSQEESHASTFSLNKDSATSTIDRLTVNDNAQRSTTDPSFTDDKSELGSISKESSMSMNKNTLLSPSTDEEDLFDVPPDLPEDPQKEDALFGRAPILSPVDGGQSDKMPVTVESLADTVIKKIDSIATNVNVTNNKSNKQDFNELKPSDINSKLDTSKNIHTKKRNDNKEIDDEQNEARRESNEELIDPLRDSSHDPLKDPSQLFAFVTKTPSPEKSKGLLFSEPDDSLFSSHLAKKPNEPKKKEALDLFVDDDVDGDLFSVAPLKRTVKKPLRDTKIGLFGDDDAQNDEDDSLFGSISRKTKLDSQKSNPTQVGRKKNVFDDNDDDDSSLFVESSGQSQKSDSASFSESKHDPADSESKSSNLKNIFGDVPCDDDVDLFATKKVVPKKVVAPSKFLFASDDDDDGDDSHIFGKQPSASTDSKARATTIAANSRPVMKKPVTRDLKKTAEKIIEDPLSLLQDD